MWWRLWGWGDGGGATLAIAILPPIMGQSLQFEEALRSNCTRNERRWHGGCPIPNSH